MLVSSPPFPGSSTPIASIPTNGGPQFGVTPNSQKLIAENNKKIKGISASILQKKNLRFFLIALAVLALSVLWIRSNHSSGLLERLTKQTNLPTEQASTTTNASQNQSIATNTKAPGITLELKSDGITAEIPNTNNQINIITEQAQKGNGVTHLARRAITQRLQDESLTLTPEQRIYAEDFVQKQMNVNVVYTGQKLSFPTELLDKAIQKAQTLTPRQIQNLSRYTGRVRF